MENDDARVPRVFTCKHSPGDDDSNGTSSRCNAKKSRGNNEAFVHELSVCMMTHVESLIVASNMVVLQWEKD